MNPTITRNIYRARTILQKRTRALFYTSSPSSIVRAQLSKPILPQVYFTPTPTHSFRSSSSRWLSTSTSKHSSQIQEDTTADWKDGPTPDVAKWNERMDYFAARAMQTEDDLGNWLMLLAEGTAAGLPNIKETILRNRMDSQVIDQYVTGVIDEGLDDSQREGYETGDYYDQEEEEEDYDEFEDDGFDEEYDTLEQISDEDIEELLEQAEEEQGDWRGDGQEDQWEQDLEHLRDEDPYRGNGGEGGEVPGKKGSRY